MSEVSPAARLQVERRQVVRIVVAGCVSWQVCVWLGSDAPPVFAVIVPLVAMHEQPFSALNVSLGRLFGVVGGLVLGILLAQWLGPSVGTIALILTLGLLAGMVLRVGGALNIQVAVSALLVFASTDPTAYATDRLWETAVGAGVTVLLAPLIFPVNPLSTFCQRFADTVDQLVAQASAASAVVSAPRFDRDRTEDLCSAARVTEELGSRLPAELKQAQRAVRFNPLHRRAHTPLTRLTAQTGLIAELSHQERVLIDELVELAAREEGQALWRATAEPMSVALNALADAIEGASAPNALNAHGFSTAFGTVRETLGEWRRAGNRPVDVMLRRRVRLLARAVRGFAAESRRDGCPCSRHPPAQVAGSVTTRHSSSLRRRRPPYR